ncbi:MAG: type II secretion system F family protein [Candidatus Omnitrophica bacterium]|nr:type II secretion system F family protein [Candidatus Omnitrophota bacterium]
MPLYEYVAKDKSGNTINDVLEAPDRQAVLDKLHGRNLILISLKEKTAGRKILKGHKAINIDDIAVFSRQLATLLDAGIPILESLDILVHQLENKNFRLSLAKIKSDVETGSSLSNAFSKHPKIFSPLYISMVKAGESSGTLDEILERLAVYLEKAAMLQRKIKSALVYPAVVTVMAFAISAVLVIKVIPVFKDVFAGFGATLPTPTIILIKISDFARKYFLLLLVMMALEGYILKRYISTEKGRLIFDRLLIKLPIVGPLFTKVAISKFTRTLSTLVRSGVPILSSLEIVAKTSGNKVFERAIDAAREGVREGESIALPLGKSNVFPPMVVRMVAIGEKTGELEKMLAKISDFYDEQVDAAVSGLTSMIEPLIIAFLGIVIGTIVICMFLPILRLSAIIQV